MAVQNRNYHTATGNHMPYEIHSVTCHPAEVTFPPLPQPKLVLDLATPEGCKTELTWVVVISQDGVHNLWHMCYQESKQSVDAVICYHT